MKQSQGLPGDGWEVEPRAEQEGAGECQGHHLWQEETQRWGWQVLGIRNKETMNSLKEVF